MISNEQLYSIIMRQLPAFKIEAEPEALRGGNLNYVWRVRGSDRNLIIKWAPPYIAANPEVPLSNQRIHFEARALDLFNKEHLLSDLASEQIRPPTLLFFDEQHKLLGMEDAGNLPSLDRWLRSTGNPVIGKELGQFIGEIHRLSYNNPVLAKRFNNIDIQQTRQKVQYNPAADFTSKCGASNVDSNLIRQQTKMLGRKLLEPGRCLVMGDLWPPSLLVKDNKIRIIDWEFAHFGQPLQDVGHWAAHCWMQAHTSNIDRDKKLFKQLWEYFWEGYRLGMGEIFSSLFNSQQRDGMLTHAGAEILVRAAGSFKEGYVYESYGKDHPLVIEAVKKAEHLIGRRKLQELWSRT